MAKYTLELDDLLRDELFELFDFNYDFYTDEPEIKRAFEQKFIDHYLFSEIGYETVYRFKHALRAHLNKNMPYWTKLYATELEAMNFDFLNNKDYTETITRELERKGFETVGTDAQSDTINKVEGSMNGSASSSSNTDTKVSNINDGVASASLSNGYLTAVSGEDSTANSSNNSTNKTDGTSKSTSSSDVEKNTDGTETETITNRGIGNIGITSTAELLEKWRAVLIDLDDIIIESCHVHFMKIY